MASKTEIANNLSVAQDARISRMLGKASKSTVARINRAVRTVASVAGAATRELYCA